MLHAYDLEETVLVEAAFIAPLVFLAVYSHWHSWWGTVHGRTLAAISIAIPVVLLHTVLIYWHLLGPNGSAGMLRELTQEARTDPRLAAALPHLRESLQPDTSDWITIQFMALIPVGFSIMAYQVIRPHTRWLLDLQQDLSDWVHRLRPHATDPRTDPLTRDADDTPARPGRPSSR